MDQNDTARREYAKGEPVYPDLDPEKDERGWTWCRTCNGATMTSLAACTHWGTCMKGGLGHNWSRKRNVARCGCGALAYITQGAPEPGELYAAADAVIAGRIRQDKRRHGATTRQRALETEKAKRKRTARAKGKRARASRKAHR